MGRFGGDFGPGKNYPSPQLPGSYQRDQSTSGHLYIISKYVDDLQMLCIGFVNVKAPFVTVTKRERSLLVSLKA